MAYNSYRPSHSSTPVVFNLIIINAIVFIAQLVFDKSFGLTKYLVLYPLGSGLFSPYQLISCMFAHGGFLHILFNMYALWLFGAPLERQWGGKKFLIFYFVCGIAAGLTELLFVSNAPSLGASGAIMGLLAAFAMSFPNVEFYILPIPFPIKAKYLALIYAGIDVFGQFSGFGGNIAHFAHLGGLAMGFILYLIWIKPQRSKY